MLSRRKRIQMESMGVGVGRRFTTRFRLQQNVLVLLHNCHLPVQFSNAYRLSKQRSSCFSRLSGGGNFEMFLEKFQRPIELIKFYDLVPNGELVELLNYKCSPIKIAFGRLFSVSMYTISNQISSEFATRNKQRGGPLFSLSIQAQDQEYSDNFISSHKTLVLLVQRCIKY